jgi:hypothetical protein
MIQYLMIISSMSACSSGLAAKTAIFFYNCLQNHQGKANYYTGILSDTIGRRNLLILGWVFAVPSWNRQNAPNLGHLAPINVFSLPLIPKSNNHLCTPTHQFKLRSILEFCPILKNSIWNRIIVRTNSTSLLTF